MSRKTKDITFMFGKRYGKLLILGEGTKKKNLRTVRCICDCGKTKEIHWCQVIRDTKSCGCYNYTKIRNGNPTHGLSKTPLYYIYTNMKARCYKKYSGSYKYYGKRGIKVCDKWRKSVSSFIEWALSNGWVKGLQVDRIDNNGNYSPENCRIVTAKENANNTSKNVSVIYKGQNTKLSEFYDIIPGLTNKILYNRIFRRNWTVERAITQRVRISPKRTIK